MDPIATIRQIRLMLDNLEIIENRQEFRNQLIEIQDATLDLQDWNARMGFLPSGQLSAMHNV